VDNFVDLVDFFLKIHKKMTQISILSTKRICRLSFMVLNWSMKDLHPDNKCEKSF